jgi:hypothetical protein
MVAASAVSGNSSLFNDKFTIGPVNDDAVVVRWLFQIIYHHADMVTDLETTQLAKL